MIEQNLRRKNKLKQLLADEKHREIINRLKCHYAKNWNYLKEKDNLDANVNHYVLILT